ncbi:unnamed protein product [Musa acuminata subsp. malaccensis]|uniref:(wild Malaysian banana) hypothetical protein n=1 Tax=Musa acuminata subsp. malaccensis TaxID=214687 RepID=A0A804JDM7_MUSAM|nr:unnamed protein product [Musa acuminata subsp. malaccensis]
MTTARYLSDAPPQIPAWNLVRSAPAFFWQSEDAALPSEEERASVSRSREHDSEGVSLFLDCLSARELLPSSTVSVSSVLWKKRKRKHVAGLVPKLHEDYDRAGQDTDEWKAREIVKDIASQGVIISIVHCLFFA